jgi:hypothetical protein
MPCSRTAEQTSRQSGRSSASPPMMVTSSPPSARMSAMTVRISAKVNSPARAAPEVEAQCRQRRLQRLVISMTA